MPVFKLPLSGDVVQSINPFTTFMTGGQFGLVNISMGRSSDPKVEEQVLSDVASYGKQLGRIGDALIVLLAHFHPRAPLTEQETKAIGTSGRRCGRNGSAAALHSSTSSRRRGEVIFCSWAGSRYIQILSNFPPGR
jgi:hypothetical protein